MKDVPERKERRNLGSVKRYMRFKDEISSVENKKNREELIIPQNKLCAIISPVLNIVLSGKGRRRVGRQKKEQGI